MVVTTRLPLIRYNVSILLLHSRLCLHEHIVLLDVILEDTKMKKTLMDKVFGKADRDSVEVI